MENIQVRIYSPLGYESTPVLTTPEAAHHLRISTRTLSRWRRRRIGPRWTYVGSQVRYRLIDLEAYLEARIAEPVADSRKGMRR